MAENKDLRDEIRELRRQSARAGAAELAAAAVDGVIVDRVDGVARDDLRELAVAVRDHPGVRAVVLAGAPDGGGVAIVSAVRPDSGLHASELIGDAARTVGGGTGKNAGPGRGRRQGHEPHRRGARPGPPGCRHRVTGLSRGPCASLGLDLGSRRIGVAVSDPTGVLATPHDVIARSGDEQADHRRILEIAAELGVECIVVGLPLSLDGHVGPAAAAALAEVDAPGCHHRPPGRHLR